MKIRTTPGKKSKTLHRLAPLDVTRLGPSKTAYHDGGGLYLQVRAAKDEPERITRSWLFRYKNRWMGLGSVDDLPLAKARKRAAELRAQTNDGVDPIKKRRDERAAAIVEEVKAAAAAVTFNQCLKEYVADRLAKRTPAYVADWRSSIERYASEVFGNLPVGAIDTPLVMKVLRPIWQDKTPTAMLVRGRIENILDWAKVSSYRDGDNPARWKGHLDHLLAAPLDLHTVVHHPALPYQEIYAFLTELRKREAVAARALEFLILTASRTGEVLGARWDEINRNDKLWQVPWQRVKKRKPEYGPHRVPLSSATLAVLARVEKLRGNSEYIFPGAQRDMLSDRVLDKLLCRMGREITVHGFRATFKTWAGECTNFPRELAELALAHTVGDVTERAYQRGDLLEKRRRLMALWAEFCAKPPGKVLEFSKKRDAMPR
jgi:integrase